MKLKIMGYVLAIPNFILLEFFVILAFFGRPKLLGTILISTFSVLFFVGSFLILRKSNARAVLKYILLLILVSVFMFVVYLNILIAWLFSGPL